VRFLARRLARCCGRRQDWLALIPALRCDRRSSVLSVGRALEAAQQLRQYRRRIADDLAVPREADIICAALTKDR
jgi:hypothetical protein